MKNRSLGFGAAFLVSLLALGVWLVSAGSLKCNLYRNLGYIHLAKGSLASSPGNLDAAERWFGISLREGCPAAPATFGLGHAYASLGEPAASVALFQQEGGRSALRRFLAGRAYEALGRVDDALREYGALPRDAAAYFVGLAALADREGRYEQALRYYSVARMINPSSTKPYYGAAFVYWRRLGDEERAAQFARQALMVETRTSFESEFYRGLLCYRMDQVDCARAAWSWAIRQKPRNDIQFDTRSLAYEMLSRSFVEAGRPERAQFAASDQRQSQASGENVAASLPGAAGGPARLSRAQ